MGEGGGKEEEIPRIPPLVLSPQLLIATWTMRSRRKNAAALPLLLLSAAVASQLRAAEAVGNAAMKTYCLVRIFF